MTRLSLKEWAIALGLLAVSRPADDAVPEESRPLVEPGETSPRAEAILLALLALAAAAAVAFVVIDAVDSVGHRTQWLGLLLGLALALLAASGALIARRLVVTEELAEPYPEPEHDDAQSELRRILEESGSRLTRRRFVLVAGAGALGALVLAALAPLLSLGPALDAEALTRTPWRRGRRLVDEAGSPIAAAAVAAGSFLSAFPEGADRELIGSPVVIVRIGPGDGGVVAYSKICTHAGCAVSLYRKPTFADVQPGPALVCPCHYSTFDPAQNGKVLFGPAGRPLPRLPLEVDRAGHLRAAGNFDAPVGPSWWGVRNRKAT